MAEFPSLGEHCGVPLCNQLDFLPIHCDSCKKTFCINHFAYDAHLCDSGKRKNVQVPVCPLCEQPVPSSRGQLPDVAVNEHILNRCEKKKKNLFQNKCSLPGCKQKELIPVSCPSCRHNFCLKHRHEKDHECEKLGGKAMSNSAIAALVREKRQSSGCSQEARQTAQMLSDEALARQLAGEKSEGVQISQEELDRRLAEELQLEENQSRRRPADSQNLTQNSSGTNCSIS